MRMLIAGEWGPSETGRTLVVHDPATGDPVGEVPEASPGDVDRACIAARDAFDGWRHTPASTRARALHRAAAGLRARTEELAATLTAEIGRPIGASRSEIERTANLIDFFAEEATRVRGEIPMMSLPDEHVMVMREPIGVVAAIAPFNYPVTLLAMKLGPALATGCTVVAKPSALAPLACLMLAEAFQDAELPPGVLNVITGRGDEAGRALVEHPIPRKVSFTGGVAAGKQIAATAAGTMKRLTLELGGQNPAIVTADADLDRAIPALVRQAYANSGQFCYRVHRVYVAANLYDDFCARFATAAAALRVGRGGEPDTDLGPLIDEAAFRRARANVQDAVDKGARLLTGGRRLRGERFDSGYFMPPTVLADTDHTMRIMREETFGPVVGIMPVDGPDDAVRLANDSRYGLAAYVFCGNAADGLRLAERCEAGTVWVDDIHRTYEFAPFGGFKESGLGREKSRFGLHEYLELKTIYVTG